MVRPEVGSTKYLANKMKAKGLQRLRWYCQACERQMRDENGFKQHTMSEAHVRQMQLIGADPRKFINQYSTEFKHDFITLLRTAHGEKPVQVNKFYQEYIANKEHIHMNATQWSSLSEFAKYLGRDGICRVTEEEGKGVFISWIDNTPEATRRQDAIRKKERQDRGDEEREKQAIEEQIRKAHRDLTENKQDAYRRKLESTQAEKITVQFQVKSKMGPVDAANTASIDGTSSITCDNTNSNDTVLSAGLLETGSNQNLSNVKPDLGVIKTVFGSEGRLKGKNIFASKNSHSVKKTSIKDQSKKMSVAERIMNQEIERKRKQDIHGGLAKKAKFSA